MVFLPSPVTLLQFSNLGHELSKLLRSVAGTGKESKPSLPQHGSRKVNIFKRGKHFQVGEKGKAQLVHPPKPTHQENEGSMEGGNGRVRIIVIDLPSEGKLSESMNDPEDMNLLWAPGITGLTG